MTRPAPAIAAAFEATWPAAETRRFGGIAVGRGMGAGGRVSSARSCGDWSAADLDAAESCHRDWGQPVLFRAWDDEDRLIAAMIERGCRIETPTLVMAAPVALLTGRPLPPVTGFTIWPPLAIQRDIWGAGAIGSARQAVMDRVPAPKTALLGRIEDRAAGAGFVACHAGVAMVHAVEVLPAFRRKGLGSWLMRTAAFWARDEGAETVALAVSRGNEIARATYAALGFTVVGSYAYYARDDAGT